MEFKIFRIVLNNGSIVEIKSENIYEALEQFVKLSNTHPREVKVVYEVL